MFHHLFINAIFEMFENVKKRLQISCQPGQMGKRTSPRIRQNRGSPPSHRSQATPSQPRASPREPTWLNSVKFSSLKQPSFSALIQPRKSSPKFAKGSMRYPPPGYMSGSAAELVLCRRDQNVCRPSCGNRRRCLGCGCYKCFSVCSRKSYLKERCSSTAGGS